MNEEGRLRDALGALGCPVEHTPYAGHADTYITFHPLGDHLDAHAAGRPLRAVVRYRVVIYARGDYEALKWQTYAALRAAGYRFAVDPGPEVYNWETKVYGWPITVERSIVIGAALDTTM